MKAADVISLYQTLESKDILIWLDGGWGVDALLEKQTREHSDVDIVAQEKDVPGLLQILKEQGFIDVPRNDTSSWNFVLGDNKGRFIDIHVIVFDKEGNGIYGPVEQGVMYPASSLIGVGYINGVEVRCLTAAYQLESHSGYELKDKDYQDIAALKLKFGLE